MGFEDEVEQSLERPCRWLIGRSKRTYELTSSIVPRGASFHRAVERGTGRSPNERCGKQQWCGIARAHLEKARSGDMAAIKELADRLDGRPAQDASVSIEHRRPEELTNEELMAIAAGGLPTAPPDSGDVH